VDQATSTDHSASPDDGAAAKEGAEDALENEGEEEAEGSGDAPLPEGQKPTAKTFPCPACRKQIEIPEGGAAAFRINVDLDPEELKQLRDDTHCSLHQGRDLSMFCMECDQVICRECKFDHHLHHKSQSLDDAAAVAKTQLSKEKRRVEEIFYDLEKNERKRERDLKEFRAKTAVVEREIRQRCSTIVTEAEKYRDAALAALQSSTVDVESAMTKELDDVIRNRKEACYLTKRIETAKSQGEGCKMVTVAKEMTSGSGSEAGVKKLKAIGHVTEVQRPVHRSTLPDDDVMFQTMKKFIGASEMVTMQCGEDEELEAREMFKCGDHNDVTVFCVKANHDGDVFLSFDPFYQEEKPHAKRHIEAIDSCEVLRNSKSKEETGRRSFIERKNRLTWSYDSRNISSKSLAEACSWALFQTANPCYIATEELVSSGLLKINKEKLFSISSKFCRAFDVGGSGTQFVMVEEAQKPDTQRKVLLYKCPPTNTKVTPVCTYTSPVTPFQPADVCFFTLKGQEVSRKISLVGMMGVGRECVRDRVGEALKIEYSLLHMLSGLNVL
jgi:hypothetical protein